MTYADDEAATAERALAEGDRAHALHHAANALFATVGDEDHLALLQRIVPSRADTDTLLPPTENLNKCDAWLNPPEENTSGWGH